ncbi:MAG: methionine ABC transporter ATP-binding protein [Treponemataceae bacterium]
MEIRLEHLKRTYPSQNGTFAAVDDVSLIIPTNTIYGIIGRSGAGKSTLVRLISLLEQVDEGSVFYDNNRVDNLSKRALIEQRRKLGMIFQSFNLFASRTAAQNIAYPLEICKASKAHIKNRVAELLELVGLSDKANVPISTLSGGQKQRVAIARSLANNPSILFCDEATSALDPQTTLSILNLIREIQQKMHLTVVMITHQMEVVRDACQRVAVLENGRVVEQGLVSDVFANPSAAVTKDFLSHLAVQEQPKLLRWSNEGGQYTLRFIGSLTDEPLLSRISQQFQVEFNIRAGGIQHLVEGDVGTLITDISGTPQEVQKALDYLRSNGVIVENGLD